MNSKSYFRHLWTILFSIVLMPFLIPFVAQLKQSYATKEELIYIGIATFFIFIIPLLILHFNHYLQSRGVSFSYDQYSGELEYKKARSKINFTLDDIASIVVYKSFSMAKNKTPTMLTDIYNYGVITLKNNTILKISSLVVYELDKVIKFESTQIRRKWYPWMS